MYVFGSCPVMAYALRDPAFSLGGVQSYSEAKVGMAAGGSMLGVLSDFLYLFVASLILGMVFGLGTAFLLKFLRSDSSPQEVWGRQPYTLIVGPFHSIC